MDLPAVTEKDKVDITTARELGADIIFASFVQSADAVRQIRQLAGPHISIVSKIESQAGIDNYDEILSASDGIMVARGDLGVQIPGERVFLGRSQESAIDDIFCFCCTASPFLSPFPPFFILPLLRPF